MGKPKRYYVVPVIEREVEVELNIALPTMKKAMPLVFADGMIGCLPVFSNKRKAQKYAGKNRKGIITIEEAVR